MTWAKMRKAMIHKAGPLIDGVQRCTRCDAILTDYRGAQVPDEDADKPLMGSSLTQPHPGGSPRAGRSETNSIV